MKKEYTIDHANATIICTKKFSKNASVLGTDECTECQALREAFPTYEFKVRSIEKNENKRPANKNLTYANMVRYIASQPNAFDNLVEFATIRNLSGEKGPSYKTVKDWFCSKFPAYLVPGVSEQEKEGAARFISLETAREILADMSNCETLDELRDVLATYFDSPEKVVSMMDKVS